MRSYIFTAAERETIRNWLRDHSEGGATRNLFHEARRNFQGIRRDVELYSELARRLRLEGRFERRVYIRPGSGSGSPSGGFESTPRRSGPSTSTGSNP